MTTTLDLEIQKVKDFFKEIPKTAKQVDEIAESICRLRSKTEHFAGKANPSPLETSIIQILDLEECMARKMEYLEAQKLDAQTLIAELTDPRQRTLLRLRYFAGKNWLEVARIMGYEWAQTHRIHKMALTQIAQNLQDR